MSEALLRARLADAAFSVDCESALDVGCGPIGRDGRAKYQLAGLRYVGIDPRVGVNAIEVAQQRRTIHLYGSALDWLPGLTDRSFDLVYALDVVEHFPEASSRKLVDEMIRVAAKRVVVFTPSGFMPLHEGVPFREHLCGWTEEQLGELGFNVEVWDFDYGLGEGHRKALWAVREAT